MARMKEMRDAYRVLGRKPEGKNHMEDPGIDGRIILKSLFEKYVGRTWTFESLSSCCESGSEPSRAIKCGEYLDWLRNCEFFFFFGKNVLPAAACRRKLLAVLAHYIFRFPLGVVKV